MQGIKYETAILAQKKGFNWYCDGYYDVNNQQVNSWKDKAVKDCLEYDTFYSERAVKYLEEEYYYQFDNNIDCYISAPTQSYLNKWLRENHNFQIEISPYHCLGKEKPYGLTIDWLYSTGKWSYIEYEGENNFEIWEDAMEKGLVESLKMLKDI